MPISPPASPPARAAGRHASRCTPGGTSLYPSKCTSLTAAYPSRTTSDEGGRSWSKRNAFRSNRAAASAGERDACAAACADSEGMTAAVAAPASKTMWRCSTVEVTVAARAVVGASMYVLGGWSLFCRAGRVRGAAPGTPLPCSSGCATLGRVRRVPCPSRPRRACTAHAPGA